MREIALHILDIVQNSVRANAATIRISIEEDVNQNLFKIVIEDNGSGMPKEMAEGIKNPFVTSRTLRKVGLGVPLLNQLCEECGGSLSIESTLGKGTKLVAQMAHDHIDRLPLGDISSTLTTLILGKPEIEYVYNHSYNGKTFLFDTREIKKLLDGAPISDLEIINWIGNYLQQNISEIHEGHV